MSTRYKLLVCGAFILSLSSLALIVIILCPSIPRLLSNKELQFDYIGAIIGIVSIIVALVLGWNIFSSIDVRGRISKVEESHGNTINQIDKLRENIETTDFEAKTALFYLQGNARLRMEECKQHLYNYNTYQSALWFALKASSSFTMGMIEQILKEMEVVLSKMETGQEWDRNISKIDKENLYNNMEDIVKSANKDYTISQREKYMDIRKRLIGIIGEKDKTNI